MAERITGHTELVSLIAKPIRHSKSPAMHNEAFAHLGLDYAYMVFEVDNETLADAVQGIRALGIVGSNVSMPNKTAIMQYLDEIDPVAELCNAVNTVVNTNGHLKGYCTDGVGFMDALKDNHIDMVGKKMVIAGAGGAATAVTIQAAVDGVAEIVVFNRGQGEHWPNAEATVRKVQERTNCKIRLYPLEDLETLRREIAAADLFVNATSAGMKPQEEACVIPDASYFRPELVVVDVIYSPAETKLLKLAKEAGCKRMNGEGMMLFQGAASFEKWTHQQMPIDHMKEVLNIRYE